MTAGRSPLVRRAPIRHTSDPVWGALVLVAFLLLSAAAAGPPLIIEASDNAAVGRVLATVPDAGVVRQSPLVRITGGNSGAVTASRQARLLDGVPGLSRPEVLGVSFGDEQASPGAQWRSVVTAADSAVGSVEGGVAGGVEGAVDRRLAAVEAPASVLRLVDGPVAGGQVWLDQDAAAMTGVGAGDEVRVAVSTTDGVNSVVLRVAGVYVLDATGIRPADVEGSAFWRERAGRLPQATGFFTIRPPLLTDVETLAEVEEPLDERVLWSVEAGLDPPVPTLGDLAVTARQVEELQAQLPPLPMVEGPLGRFIVAGGIPGIQQASEGIAATAVERTRGISWSAIAMAGAALLAVALANEARRGHERRLEVATGLHPAQVGVVRVLEVVPLAVAATGVGVAVAWLAVTLGGPPGETSWFGLAASVLDGVTAVAAGLLLVGVVGAVSSWRTARLTRSSGSSGGGRTFPWRAVLVVTTAVTVVGVVSGGGSEGLDVLAPLLVAASCGALVAAVALALLRRVIGSGTRAGATSRTAATSQGSASAGPTGRDRAVASVLSPRQARRILALRRLAAPGRGHDVVVVLLTCGLALAGFTALAARSVEDTLTSKADVLVGARSVVKLPSGTAPSLDPAAADRPVFPPDVVVQDLQSRPVDLNLTPAVDIRVPPGDTVVWTDQVFPGGGGQLRMLVLDTDEAASVLVFGRGSGALQEAREGLAALRVEAAGRRLGDDGRLPPVLVAGDPDGFAVGDVIELRGRSALISVEVVGTVPVFPGQGSSRTLLIADTDTYLPALQRQPEHADGHQQCGDGGLVALHQLGGHESRLHTG